MNHSRFRHREPRRAGQRAVEAQLVGIGAAGAGADVVVCSSQSTVVERNWQIRDVDGVRRALDQDACRVPSEAA